MLDITYPGLHHEANEASNAQQKIYLNLIKGEYAALVVAAIFGLDLLENKWYYVVYALVFFAPFVLLMARVTLKPEQEWYKCRALAESVKTSTWKYAMGARPFENSVKLSDPRRRFCDHLKFILATNERVGKNFVGKSVEMEQITPEMDAIRLLKVSDRLQFYVENRINEQRRWYVAKANANRRSSKWTIAALIVLYAVAALSVASRIAQPDWRLDRTEPIVVMATALIGWMQIKKFNELAASYTLTAIEIGIVKNRVQDVFTDEELSSFVDDSEQAFSREHTQWAARQSR